MLFKCCSSGSKKAELVRSCRMARRTACIAESEGFEVAGKRRRGRRTRRWHDSVKIDMHEFGLTPEMAEDRTDWKGRTASRANRAQPGQARSR